MVPVAYGTTQSHKIVANTTRKTNGIIRLTIAFRLPVINRSMGMISGMSGEYLGEKE